MVIQQYEVYWVNLDPTVGHEIKKTRPCVVISPDELNRNIGTVMIAPLTTRSKSYPTRIATIINKKKDGLYWIRSGQLISSDCTGKLGKLMEKQSQK